MPSVVAHSCTPSFLATKEAQIEGLWFQAHLGKS
jgi:hypothetical protein